MEYVTVELPKFLKDCEQLEGETEEQLFLLSNMGRLRERPEKFSDQKFDKLFQVTNLLRFATRVRRRLGKTKTSFGFALGLH